MENKVPDKQPWFKFRRSWLMAAKKLRNVSECQDFFAALEAFADGLDYTAKTDRVDMILDDMRDFLQYSRKSYENMQKGGRKSSNEKEGNQKKENGKERKDFSIDKVNEKSNTENQPFSENPLKPLKTGLNKENENENENEKKNTPHSPLLAGAASGGDGFKFLGFLAEHGRLVNTSASWQMPAGCDDIDRERAAWICTDKRMQPQIVLAISEGDGNKLKKLTNKQSSGAWSRELWKLCEAVSGITPKQLENVGGCNDLEAFRQAVAHEVNTKRMSDEGTAVFKAVLGKMEYIKQGNKISSLPGFLASRGK